MAAAAATPLAKELTVFQVVFLSTRVMAELALTLEMQQAQPPPGAAAGQSTLMLAMPHRVPQAASASIIFRFNEGGDHNE